MIDKYPYEPQRIGLPPIVFDGTCSIVRVIAREFYSVSQVADHFVALTRIVNDLRHWDYPIRILIDSRGAPVLSAEAATLVEVNHNSLYNARDRIALVVETALLKRQSLRLVSPQNHQVFDEMGKAETWLIQPHA